MQGLRLELGLRAAARIGCEGRSKSWVRGPQQELGAKAKEMNARPIAIAGCEYRRLTGYESRS